MIYFFHHSNAFAGLTGENSCQRPNKNIFLVGSGPHCSDRLNWRRAPPPPRGPPPREAEGCKNDQYTEKPSLTRIPLCLTQLGNKMPHTRFRRPRSRSWPCHVLAGYWLRLALAISPQSWPSCPSAKGSNGRPKTAGHPRTALSGPSIGCNTVSTFNAIGYRLAP